MLFRMTELKYKVNPVLERALDVLFILHADHEQNCSTSAMRGDRQLARRSVLGDGRRGGGALRPAARRRQRGGAADAERDRHVDNVPGFIKRVKAGEGRLMGFGHRVYKSYDPRAKIIKQTADEVFEVTGRNPLLDIALELERIALQDEYFVTRKLYPNVDFYSGLIYQAMGFPVDDVPGAVRDSADGGLDRAVGRDAARPGAEDRAAKQIYIGVEAARLRPARQEQLTVRRGEGAAVRWCGGAVVLASHPARLQHRRRDPERPRGEVRQRARLRAPAAAGGFRSAAGRLAALAQTRQYILAELKAAGIAGARADALDAQTPLGRVRMVNVIAHDSRPASGPHRARHATTTPSCFANSASSAPATAPRRPRRSSSSAACSRRGRTSSPSSCCSSTARRRSSTGTGTTTTPTAAVTTCETAQKAGTLAGLKALVLLDMIGDRNLTIRRDSNSTPWLNDIVWASAGRLGHRANFLAEETDRSRTTTCRSCGRRPVRRHHRPRLPRLAHGAGRPRPRQRAQPADRRRRRARRAPANREAAGRRSVAPLLLAGVRVGHRAWKPVLIVLDAVRTP